MGAPDWPSRVRKVLAAMAGDIVGRVLEDRAEEDRCGGAEGGPWCLHAPRRSIGRLACCSLLTVLSPMQTKRRTGSPHAYPQIHVEVALELPCSLRASMAARPSCPACCRQVGSYMQRDRSDAASNISLPCIELRPCHTHTHSAHLHQQCQSRLPLRAAGGLASFS